MKAQDILRRSAQHIEERAAARDQEGGERSMARTVAAFNAITGHQVSERDGWLFMAVLKAARACNTPAGIPDDYEDLAAYAALAGECVAPASPPSAQVPAPDDGSSVVEVLGEGGLRLIVPQGYKWIAQDADGVWFAYENEPDDAHYGDYWAVGSGRFTEIARANPTEDWRTTKRQVRQ